MAAAFLVEYRHMRGFQGKEVVIFDSPCECAADLGRRIKNVLVNARSGVWNPAHVTVAKIEYLGPWVCENLSVSVDKPYRERHPEHAGVVGPVEESSTGRTE